jgi:uroporphyrinogen-III decarboxylase
VISRAAQVAEMLSSFPTHCGHVANLGHGIYLDTPVDAVRVFVDAVHDLRHDRCVMMLCARHCSLLTL